MTNYAPELGQMLFGAAYGSFEPGELGNACLQSALSEIDRVFWNREQREWDRHEDPRIAGVTFRPYCWGDCDCGREAAESAWCDAHSHAESCYQTEYRRLYDAHRDARSTKKNKALADEAHDRDVKALCERRGIPWNDGYACAVHCTCGHDRAWQEWSDAHPHAATCSPELPNLAYGDIEFRWYKHDRRGVTVQREVTPDEWAAWLSGVLAIIRAAEATP